MEVILHHSAEGYFILACEDTVARLLSLHGGVVKKSYYIGADN